MNIVKLLNGRTGKMALSAMQAVGLSAAVGVAGVAAWQMLGASAQPGANTVFSAQDEDVVFVADAPGAGAYGGNYGAGGEVRSGLRATLSKDMRLMQADFEKKDVPSSSLVRKENEISAFKMDGATGGLGMDGANAAKELGGMGSAGDFSAIQQQILDLQAAAQQQAAGAAASVGDAVQAAAGAAAGAGQGRGGMARAVGHNLQSTPLQAGNADGAVVSPSGVLGGAQAAGSAAVAAGTQSLAGGRSSRSSFGQTLAWGGGDEKQQLAFLQKQSGDIAHNKTRTANEGTRAFMAAERMAGGVYLDDGGTLTTGGASSADFGMNDSLSTLGSVVAGASGEVETYEDAKKKLSDDIKSYRNKMAVSCGLMQFVCQTWAWKLRNNARKKVKEFEEKWGDTDYMKTDTRGNLADDARWVINRIYGRSWGGAVMSLTAMYNGEFGDKGDHVFGRKSD